MADPLCTSLKLWNVKDDGREQIIKWKMKYKDDELNWKIRYD